VWSHMRLLDILVGRLGSGWSRTTRAFDGARSMPLGSGSRSLAKGRDPSLRDQRDAAQGVGAAIG